ncbi:MAG: FliH/SctL family protein [Syntrophaceticus sp.]|jgi:flagellar assembly protein FliH|nr:FliH/SctL family protein [Syntrophaceticus sp.]
MILKSKQVTICPFKESEQVEKEEEANEINNKDLEAVAAKTKLTALKMLNEAKSEAEKLLDDAEKEVEERLAKAEQESGAIRERAAAKGYKEGYRRAEQALESERQHLEVDRLEQEKQLELERQKMIKELEPAIIQMALQVAKMIIHTELQLHPNQVASIATAVLSKVSDLRDVTLNVSAEDYKIAADILPNSTLENGIKVEIDDFLRKGDCAAETPFGIVDGTIDGQFEEIERRFLEVAGNG